MLYRNAENKDYYISNLQNENARRLFCIYQSTCSLASQNTCFKSCFYVKAASLSYHDIRCGVTS